MNDIATADYRVETWEDEDGVVHNSLADLEERITEGLRTFVDVGMALAEIRDFRMYRATHDTFEAYCEDRWHFTDRRARQIIDAAETVANMPTGSMLPVNERQAAELRGLDPEPAAELMREAHRVSDGKPTAKTIREVRDAATVPPRADTTTTGGKSLPPELPKFADHMAVYQSPEGEVADSSGVPAVSEQDAAPPAVEPPRSAEELRRERDEADREATVGRFVNYLRAFLAGVSCASALDGHELRDDVLAALSVHERDRFLRIEKEASWPTTI